jgi:hypothetical protein
LSLFTKHFSTGLVYAFWFAAVTLSWFVPFSIDNIIRVGIVPFLIFDGNGRSAGATWWGGYDVRFYPLCFAITILLWIISLIVIHRWLRYVDSKA